MTRETAHERLWTSANVVTLLRICFIPLFVVALLSPWPTWLAIWPDAGLWKEWVAAGIFIMLAGTDALDGYLARSRGEITNFGKFMDPLADKILVAAALLALIELGVLPSWVALIILCREFIVSGIRMVAASQGIIIAASWYGKAKTASQIIALVLFIIKDNHMVSDFSSVLSDHLYLISWGVMIVALVLTVLSMLDYLSKAREVLGFRPKLSKAEKAEPEVATDADVSDDALSVVELSTKVLENARRQNLSIATAESCTGGMIASALTAIPGSSDVFKGGIVSYSNEVKTKELGVDDTTLSEYGAVSEQTAREMASGASRILDVDVAVAVTGIAGPEGGTAEKPVGTVWIGLAYENHVQAQKYLFKGNRREVREQTVDAALRMLSGVLESGKG